MDRYEMLDDLEQYWLKVQQENPEETMDIPAAMQYYRSCSDEELEYEHSRKCR